VLWIADAPPHRPALPARRRAAHAGKGIARTEGGQASDPRRPAAELAGQDRRGRRRAANSAGKIGVVTFDKQEPARVTDRRGVLHRGTMFYADLPETRGYSRRAKIIIVRLTPDTWAQAWIITQAGMNHVEYNALDKVLTSITLATE
jgi:hypothetical protein